MKEKRFYENEEVRFNIEEAQRLTMKVYYFRSENVICYASSLDKAVKMWIAICEKEELKAVGSNG
jgi:hypothetical protein